MLQWAQHERVSRTAAFCVLALSLTAQGHAQNRVPLDLAHWRIEGEDPATRVTRRGALLDIDSPKGLTLWLDRPLDAPVTIRFQARAVTAGGANDKVSDLNAFWMASEADGTSPLAHPRTGRFEDYDTLRTYYVGIGGNRNSTTRMRRYVARPGDRPLRPEHDRTDPAAMLVANRWTTITLTARDGRATVERDGRPLFALTDTAPYRHGWFALRTTWSHLQIRNLTIDAPSPRSP
ncbi:DUF6250 domain-containing protein [Sphingomonas sp. BIUV-7]|uniref:DUF6250 domain-containing protein n=1 Tax=Sphingomonas natans TaxID=3063330 RepID=A0ABT8Y3K0_9SPHN|nr:DUF6250 domain-containing protein [Sphingomonas sp. BIUV-7]MDO6412878.1 DUF6250 domain-containing protein [Sphingomonas sp. BIUV-7]